LFPIQGNRRLFASKL